MNDESSKNRAVEGTIVSGRANSFPGFILEVQADMGFSVGDRVWISRTMPTSHPAEQPRGEPVALGYAPGELDRTAPEVIYLQVDTAGDNDERDEPWTGDMDENVSWCAESIGGLEIQYVRGDLIAQTKPEQAECGTCGEVIRADVMTGTTCACAKPEQPVGDVVDRANAELAAFEARAMKEGLDLTRYNKGHGKHINPEVDAMWTGWLMRSEHGAPRPAVATPAEEGLKLDPDSNECSPDPVVRKAFADGYDQGFVHGSGATPAEVTDDAASLMLRKITERVEHYERIGRRADQQYVDGRRHEAQFILDACKTALTAQCQVRKDGQGVEGWIVVKEHAWDHGDGGRPTLAYLWPSEFDRRVFDSFEQASAFIRENQFPLGWVALKIASPSAGAVVPEGHVTLPREELKRLRTVLAMAAHPYPSPHAEYIDRVLAAAQEVVSHSQSNYPADTRDAGRDGSIQ